MSVKIRLARFGKKKAPIYRIIAADSKTARDGKNLEVLGLYDPGVDPIKLELNPERISYWLSVGAQPSDTASRLLATQGLVPAKVRTSSRLGISKKDRKSDKK